MHARIMAIAALLLVAGAMPAHAYLDPGTGSIIAQAVIGAAVAAGVFFRVWWARLRTLLGQSKSSRAADADDQG